MTVLFYNPLTLRLRAPANLLRFSLELFNIQTRTKTQQLDFSRFPKLESSDLEETFVRGSGPGGQAVNKTSNCVVLRHIPTNIIVKCHIHRTVSQNQKEARTILLNKLDVLYNGSVSIEAQKRAIERKKAADKLRRQRKNEELRKKWEERENSD